jgi:hypothetical protein
LVTDPYPKRVERLIPARRDKVQDVRRAGERIPAGDKNFVPAGVGIFFQ